MPPICEHKSASPISQHRQNPSSSGEDDIKNLSPKSDKPLSMVDKKRGKRSPSINTRASRVVLGNVGTSKLHYRFGTSDESYHYSLIYMAAFNRFWSSFNEPSLI
ncbi:unnamed protein product [Rhizophagus irregularis]|nr:unnamed protein product [Rhizophagus irregularis]